METSGDQNVRKIWGWAVEDALGWRLERRTRLMKEAIKDGNNIIILYSDAVSPHHTVRTITQSQRMLIEDIIRIEGLAGIQRLGREKLIFLTEANKIEIVENRINEILNANGIKRTDAIFRNLSDSLLRMIYNDVTPDDMKSVEQKQVVQY